MGKLPSTLEAISRVASPPIVSAASAWAPKKLRGVCQTAHHISPNRLACVSTYGCTSLGKDKRVSSQTIRPYDSNKKGSSSDGRASALHAEGRGIDALLLNSYFAFFLLTGSRSKPEKQAMTPVCDPIREKSSFPVFCLSFWPLVSRFGQSEPSSPNQNVSHRSVENRGATRHCRTNDRVESGDRRWQRHSVPARHAAVSVHPKQLVPARLRAHRPKRRTPVNVTGKAHRIERASLGAPRLKSSASLYPTTTETR